MPVRSEREPASVRERLEQLQRGALPFMKVRSFDQLSVTAPEAVLRGEELHATVEIGQPREDLRVGLVCYGLHRSADADGTHWSGEREHEQWHELPPIAGQHRLVWQLPLNGPYSYKGERVEYHWQLWAEWPRTLKSDTVAVRSVWVEP